MCLHVNIDNIMMSLYHKIILAKVELGFYSQLINDSRKCLYKETAHFKDAQEHFNS